MVSGSLLLLFFFFFFNDTATTEIYTSLHTLSLHDALPISSEGHLRDGSSSCRRAARRDRSGARWQSQREPGGAQRAGHRGARRTATRPGLEGERPLVEQHVGAPERRPASACGAGEEGRRARAVHQVHEQAAERRGSVTHAWAAAREAERRRVHHQGGVLEPLAA